VRWVRAPLEFRVSPKPLYLLKPIDDAVSADDQIGMPPQRGA
jgi:hypothetical protein